MRISTPPEAVGLFDDEADNLTFFNLVNVIVKNRRTRITRKIFTTIVLWVESKVSYFYPL